jgi:acetyltransferase-like isoleucine patch superfamily enzyme
MTKTLLIVAPISHNGIELFETAEELGWTPISAQPSVKESGGRFQEMAFSDVPETLWRGAIFVSSVPVEGLPLSTRLDRRWRMVFQSALDYARDRGAESFVSLVHPMAYVSPSAVIGQNVFVGPGATISSSTTIGDFSRIGRGSTVGHDVSIASSVSIGPGVTIPGSVTVSSNVTIGPGVTFINGILVGSDSFIAAGSVVTRRVLEGSLVMGNPARRPRNPIRAIRSKFKRVRGRLLRKLGVYASVRSLYRRLRP